MVVSHPCYLLVNLQLQALLTGVGIAVGVAVAAPVVIPAAIGALGFGSGGIAAGSTGAWMMSLGGGRHPRRLFP